MTSEGLGEMFEGDSADMCAGKFLLLSMGGRAEGLACADPGGRTPIGSSGITTPSLDYLFLFANFFNKGFWPFFFSNFNFVGGCQFVFAGQVPRIFEALIFL